MTPEERTARAKKAGQAAAANRQIRKVALAKRIADAEADAAKRQRQNRMMLDQSLPTRPGGALAGAAPITEKATLLTREEPCAPADITEPSDRALGERVLAMMDHAPVAEPRAPETVPESVRWAMAAVMLDPPFVASPEGNRQRMMILDRALAEAARLGWTLKQ